MPSAVLLQLFTPVVQHSPFMTHPGLQRFCSELVKTEWFTNRHQGSRNLFKSSSPVGRKGVIFKLWPFILFLLFSTQISSSGTVVSLWRVCPCAPSYLVCSSPWWYSSTSWTMRPTLWCKSASSSGCSSTSGRSLKSWMSGWAAASVLFFFLISCSLCCF